MFHYSELISPIVCFVLSFTFFYSVYLLRIFFLAFWKNARLQGSFSSSSFLPSYSNALVYSERGCQLHEFKQQRVQEKAILAQLTAFCRFARCLLEPVVQVLANIGTCGSVRWTAIECQHFKILGKKHAMHFSFVWQCEEGQFSGHFNSHLQSLLFSVCAST